MLLIKFIVFIKLIFLHTRKDKHKISNYKTSLQDSILRLFLENISKIDYKWRGR